VRDAVLTLAFDHCFDPVLDMLAQAEAAWDGVERLGTMATDYLNAEDTVLNNTCLRKWVIAAVARVRNPGCKFDNILMLESAEGWDKSTFFLVLAGAPENFSDEAIIGKAGREVQENLGSIWIHENAELGGMRKAEVETVKAFASRQVDRARPPYGRFQREQARHSVEAGTTNKDNYLLSQDGNRRFWGMKLIKPINIEKFKQDRLQLLGEAAHYQSQGESLFLDKSLWGVAAIAQEARRLIDPWEDLLENLPETVDIVEWNAAAGHHMSKRVMIIHTIGGNNYVTINDILTYVLKIPVERQHNGHGMKVSPIMKKLGWEKAINKIKIGNDRWNGYTRKAKLV
jgi:predicted P-loop ATPase